MSSVRNRILQFQSSGSTTGEAKGDSFLVNGSGLFNNSYTTPSTVKAHAPISTNSSSNIIPSTPTNNTNTSTMNTITNHPNNLHKAQSHHQPSKKASMTINLSGNTATTNINGTHSTSTSPTKPLPAGNKPKVRTPTNSSSGQGGIVSVVSSIPKLVTSQITPGTVGSSPSKLIVNGSSPSAGGTMSSSRNIGNSSNINPTSKLYGSMDWKEKYEEAERKRLHLVTLAQKG